MLYRCGVEFRADLFEIGDAVFTAVAVDANLDQFVGIQVALDFLEHGIGQAVFGNRDDRIQIVGAGA